MVDLSVGCDQYKQETAARATPSSHSPIGSPSQMSEAQWSQALNQKTKCRSRNAATDNTISPNRIHVKHALNSRLVPSASDVFISTHSETKHDDAGDDARDERRPENDILPRAHQSREPLNDDFEPAPPFVATE